MRALLLSAVHAGSQFCPRFPSWSATSGIVAEWGSKMQVGQVSITEGSDELGRRMEAILQKEGCYAGKKSLVR